jgi:hypothetical protein
MLLQSSIAPIAPHSQALTNCQTQNCHGLSSGLKKQVTAHSLDEFAHRMDGAQCSRPSRVCSRAQGTGVLTGSRTGVLTAHGFDWFAHTLDGCAHGLHGFATLLTSWMGVFAAWMVLMAWTDVLTGWTSVLTGSRNK